LRTPCESAKSALKWRSRKKLGSISPRKAGKAEKPLHGKMTAQERKDSARRAAQVRWAKVMQK